MRAFPGGTTTWCVADAAAGLDEWSVTSLEPGSYSTTVSPSVGESPAVTAPRNPRVPRTRVDDEPLGATCFSESTNGSEPPECASGRSSERRTVRGSTNLASTEIPRKPARSSCAGVPLSCRVASPVILLLFPIPGVYLTSSVRALCGIGMFVCRTRRVIFSVTVVEPVPKDPPTDTNITGNLEISVLEAP